MPVNILVADDSVTIRRIMELTFAGEDAQVTTVESGQACVERAREMVPDVVFADVSMPAMDGYDVASALKSSPGLEQTAVVLLASQKNPYDEGRGKNCGVDDHVLKPFDTQHVIDRVNQVLARPRVKAAAGAQATPQTQIAPPPPAASPAPAAAGMNGGHGGATRSGGPVVPIRQEGGAAAGAAAARAPRPAVAAVAAAHTSNLQGRLQDLGLDAAQVKGVLALSREVIEQVVWEVVPELAETIIREEIQRLTAE